MPAERRLEDRLPGLEGADYRITSPQDTDYNCVGWALSDDERWWSPVVGFGSFWPAQIPRALDIGTFIDLFELQGFERCETEDVEAGFEKIALFAESGSFAHVARQLASGRWTSKLGNDVDIEHELRDLTRRRSPFPQYLYGAVAAVMRRPRRQGTD